MQASYRLPMWAVAFLMIRPFAASAQIVEPVRVESGLLAGVTGSDPAVRVYRGVPYAAPPVGDLRWRPPQPPASWEGVRHADQFAASAVQEVTHEYLPWTKEFMVQNEVSEDCLYLNVWTAAKAAGEKRPILVYIHGGAFFQGSGAVAVYDGEELAMKGLVVVTINYRLGLLGFFAHPELTQESAHHSSGNYALLDQVAALQWIHRNIAAFGGDPNRVTIVGQSAGAASVHYLTASPLATGLFQRAIAESGSGLGRSPRQTLAEAEQDGVKFADEKGAHSLRDLRAMSVADLTAHGPKFNPSRWGPVVDGWFLPTDVSTVFAQGKQNDVPMLTGINADEGSASPAYGKAKATEFRQQAQQRFGSLAEPFMKLYPADTDEQAGNSARAIRRDEGRVSMALWAENRAKTSKTKAFLYYFDRVIPWPTHPEYGAFHTSEVPYVFRNLKVLDRPWEPIDWKVADTLSSYWANFAATGDPNGKGLPRWPVFDAHHARFMRLGATPEPMPLPDKAKFDLLKEHLTK